MIRPIGGIAPEQQESLFSLAGITQIDPNSDITRLRSVVVRHQRYAEEARVARCVGVAFPAGRERVPHRLWKQTLTAPNNAD